MQEVSRMAMPDDDCKFCRQGSHSLTRIDFDPSMDK